MAMISKKISGFPFLLNKMLFRDSEIYPKNT